MHSVGAKAMGRQGDRWTRSLEPTPAQHFAGWLEEQRRAARHLAAARHIATAQLAALEP